MKRIGFGLLFLLLGIGLAAGPARAQQSSAPAEGLQKTLEYNKTNQATKWVDPDTGKTGAITPIKTFTNAQGQPCREFTENIFIAGKEQQGYGTACRQPDGSWQIVPTSPPPGNGSTAAASAPEESSSPPVTVHNYYSGTYPPPYPYSWGYAPPYYPSYYYYAPFGFSLGFNYAVWPRHDLFRFSYHRGRHFHRQRVYRWDRDHWGRDHWGRDHWHGNGWRHDRDDDFHFHRDRHRERR